jgi:short chain dehydrogenase
VLRHSASDQPRQKEIRHARTPSSYRLRLQFRLDGFRGHQGIDLAGKTAIVTSGHSGFGRETARELRGAGARVIVPARDPRRAAAALAGIDVEIEPMDLLDPVAIDAFAERYLTSGQPPHILVNTNSRRMPRRAWID